MPLERVSMRRSATDARSALDQASIEMTPPRGPLQASQVLERFADAHATVEPALLRQVADAVANTRELRLSEHLDPAGVRTQHVHEHAQRGRLPRAVRPDHAVDAPRADLERERVDRELVGEALRHARYVSRAAFASGRRGDAPQARIAACRRWMPAAARRPLSPP
jgi:hypothetical protein